jgi:hypothetical protein
MLCAFNTVASIKQRTGPPPPGFVTGLPNGTYVATAQRAATTPPTPIFYLPLQGNITNYGTTASTPTSTSPQYLALANPVFNGNYNGTFNYITINNTILYNKPNYTIACWVYVNRFGSNNWICSNQFDGQNSIAMLSLTCTTNSNGTFTQDTDGHVYFHTKNAAPNIKSTRPITTGNWAHIAVSGSINSATMYINGQANGTVNSTGSMNLFTPSGTGVSSIGAWTSSGITSTYRFDGLISDFRVYDSTLTSTQVQDLYNMRVHYGNITVTGGQYTFSGLQTGKNYNLYLSTLGNANPDYTGTIQT